MRAHACVPAGARSQPANLSVRRCAGARGKIRVALAGGGLLVLAAVGTRTGALLCPSLVEMGLERRAT